MSRYRTIVADPPWPYSGFATLRGPCTSAEVRARWRRGVRIEKASLPYRSMSLDEIGALPIGEMAAPDCRLFLWTTQRFLPHALTIMADWGFQYRQTLVWHKTTSFSPFGGSLAPNNAEFVLVGRQGKPAVIERARSCVIATPGFAGRRKAHGSGPVKHSRKPDGFFDLAEQVSPGPYLELFARRARPGWDVWGDEAPGAIEWDAAARPG